MLRGVISRHERVVSDRRRVPPIGKYTKCALMFAIACGFWLSFKQVEPRIFPVVKNFSIEAVQDLGSSIAISGRFDKVRGCRFVEIVGYSGNEFVTVTFKRSPDAPVVSRIVRDGQTYGPWLLVPKVPSIELFATHICSTGFVKTKIFSGAIVL